jgi:hypothetical protein
VWTVGLEKVRVRGLLIYESSSNVDRQIARSTAHNGRLNLGRLQVGFGVCL